MDNDSFKVVARLDVPKSVKLIKDDIPIIENNLQSNNVKITAGLNIEETKKIIQSQLDTIVSQLKIKGKLIVPTESENNSITQNEKNLKKYNSEIDRTIEKLEKMGYSVPEDISVTGFDNYPFIRRNASGLTTVDVDIAMMASEGVELLLERLNDKRETFVRRVVSGHIVIRKSTGKAATEP